MTLYRVGVVKESGGVTYAAIDGGMSDNPRPQLYDARYEALLANRADELPTGVYRIAGKHCESGDVLIEAAELPRPEPGDLLAVPATGAYTLALGSTYNGVPRPAVVLVDDGRRDRSGAERPWRSCCASRSERASGDGEQTPLARDALEREEAAFLEVDPRAGDQVLDGARHEHLAAAPPAPRLGRRCGR